MAAHILFAITIIIPFVTPNSILVLNAGFEEDWYPIPSNTFYYTQPVPKNWERYNPSGATFGLNTDTGVANPKGGKAIRDDEFNDTAAEGHQVAWIDQYKTEERDAGELGIYQKLEHMVDEDATYTLSVWVANPASNNWSNNSESTTYYDYTGFPGYKIQLIAVEDDDTSTVLGEDDDLLSPLHEGQWVESVIEISIPSDDPNVGKALGIRLINKNVNNELEGGMEVYFDDVRLQLKYEDVKKGGGKKSSAGVIVVIILLIILCIVGIGLFVWWKRKKETGMVVLGDRDEDRKNVEADHNALVATI